MLAKSVVSIRRYWLQLFAIAAAIEFAVPTSIAFYSKAVSSIATPSARSLVANHFVLTCITLYLIIFLVLSGVHVERLQRLRYAIPLALPQSALCFVPSLHLLVLQNYFGVMLARAALLLGSSLFFLAVFLAVVSSYPRELAGMKRLGETSEREKGGTFFRTEGPSWTDFEEGFVFERPEVDLVVHHIERHTTELVIGEGASGKSVVLLNAGYKLTLRGYNVFYVTLKQGPFSVEPIWIDLQTYDYPNSVLIFDDIHLHLESLRPTLRYLANTKYLRMILGGRTILKDRLTDAEKEEWPEVVIKAQTAVEGISRHYVKKKFQGMGGLRGELTGAGLRELEAKCGNDLWVLASLLQTMMQDRIEMGYVWDALGRRLDKLREIDIEAADVVLSISPLYSYEIPVEEAFLLDSMGLRPEAVKKLVDRGEIVRDGSHYRIHHSSLAQLYVQASKQNSELTGRIRSRLREHNLGRYPEDLIHFYFQSKPDDPAAFFRLDRRYFPSFFEPFASTRNLVTNARTRRATCDAIRAGRIDMFARFSSYHLEDWTTIDFLVEELGSSWYRQQINESVNIAAGIACLRELLFNARYRTFRRIFLETLNSLRMKASKERDPAAIKSALLFLEHVHSTAHYQSRYVFNRKSLRYEYRKLRDKKVMRTCVDIIENMNLNLLTQLITKEGFSGFVFYCVSPIFRVSPAAARRLIGTVDVTIAKSVRVEYESNHEFPDFIESLFEISPALARSALAEIDTDIIPTLTANRDPQETGRILAEINRACPELARKILTGYDIQTLSDMLLSEEETDGIWSKASFLSMLSAIEPSVASNVLAISRDRLLDAIEFEGSHARDIMFLVTEIVPLDRELARIMLERIRPMVTASSGVGLLWSCIVWFSSAREKMLSDFLDKLLTREEVRRRLSECQDSISEILGFASDPRVSELLDEDTLGILARRIEQALRTELFKVELSHLLRTNPSVGRRLLSKLRPTAFVEAARSTGYFGVAMDNLTFLKNFDRQIVEASLSDSNISGLFQRIVETEDLRNSLDVITTLYGLSPSTARRFVQMLAADFQVIAKSAYLPSLVKFVKAIFFVDTDLGQMLMEKLDYADVADKVETLLMTKGIGVVRDMAERLSNIPNPRAIEMHDLLVNSMRAKLILWEIGAGRRAVD
jgi:hypothetical protein